MLGCRVTASIAILRLRRCDLRVQGSCTHVQDTRLQSFPESRRHRSKGSVYANSLSTSAEVDSCQDHWVTAKRVWGMKWQQPQKRRVFGKADTYIEVDSGTGELLRIVDQITSRFTAFGLER